GRYISSVVLQIRGPIGRQDSGHSRALARFRPSPRPDRAPVARERAAGGGPYRYARNGPAFQFDPSGGLTNKAGRDDKRGCNNKTQNCGKCYAYWLYELSQAAPCPGYIVQRIDVDRLTSDCSHKSVDHKGGTYYEAWPVDLHGLTWNGIDKYGVKRDNA